MDDSTCDTAMRFDLLLDCNKAQNEYLLSVDTTTCEPLLHYHDFMQMWYNPDVPYMHAINGKKHILPPGSLMIIPPFFNHAMEYGNTRMIRIEFTQEFIRNSLKHEPDDSLFNMICLKPILARSDLAQPYYTFSGDSRKRIESILQELVNDFSLCDQFSDRNMRANIIRFLTVLAREFKSGMVTQNDEQFDKYSLSLQNAFDFINTHYNEKIQLSDVCKIALMSQSSFSKIFTKLTLNTFSQYLLDLRLLQARKLLLTTDRTINDICVTCGFSSPTFFYRTFKKVLGCNPHKYRKEFICDSHCEFRFNTELDKIYNQADKPINRI